MASTQPAHDPALAHATAAPAAPAPAPNNAQLGTPSTQPTLPANLIASMSHEQIASVLKHIPDLFSKVGDLKDSAAAEALSHLSQGTFHPATPGQFQPGVIPNQPPVPGQLTSEPGPSSHPRGPPNLGQLSAIASVLQASAHQAPPPTTEGVDGGADDAGDDSSPDGGDKPTPSKGSGRRGGRSATMSNDEWARIRKDNHKEVERRRRGNINEGINELGRIVPNGSGEKAKGAILSRAVQYIHHLKENEARNIEKWTLEKLLMDQAMGDLQAQLEEMRRMWDEERVARQRAEAELELLRGHTAAAAAASASAPSTTPAAPAPSAPASATLSPKAAPAAAAAAPASAKPDSKDSGKREREEEEEEVEGELSTPEGEERAKRQRVE